MIKINICNVVLFYLVTMNQGLAELTCSRTGTTVLYVNGINTSKVQNNKTAGLINSAIGKMHNKIDQKSVSGVKGVYNYSAGILDDIAETKAQVAINHLGEKRERYWRRMALAEVISFPGTQKIDLRQKVSEAFDQLYRVKPRIDLITKEIDQDYFTELDFYKSMRKYAPMAAVVYGRAYSDNATVEELKNKVLESYNKGKGKVIVVAHSQGNEVLYSAIERINAQAVPSYLVPDTLTQWSEVNNKWFNSVIGYVQLAPPSPRLVSPPSNAPYSSNLPKINHSRYMRLDLDKIINKSYLANRATAVPVNLEYDLFGTYVELSKSTMDTMEILEKINLFSTAGYHSIENVYLSKNFTATSESGKSQTMFLHFQDAIAEVASELEDNCKVNIPQPERAICQVWVTGTNEAPIYFAYEGILRGVEVNLPENRYYKKVDTGCGILTYDYNSIDGYFMVNGERLYSRGAWCSGLNNKLTIQSIGDSETEAFTYSYGVPCYQGRVFSSRTGVVPL